MRVGWWGAWASSSIFEKPRGGEGKSGALVQHFSLSASGNLTEHKVDLSASLQNMSLHFTDEGPEAQ